jgi:alkyl hydroperoxide reductase subunit F
MMYETIVIGGGPAGLAATMYCVRKGMDVLLVTAALGGKTTLGLNLPDMTEYHVLKAREQVQVYRARIEYLSHVWREGRVSEVTEDEAGFRLTVSGSAAAGPGTSGEPSGSGAPGSRRAETEILAAERIVIATGTLPRPLGVPGEREFFGNGLGSSAISYSHLLRERRVVVIGDSDRAIEAAVECSLQADSVVLILEPRAEYSHGHLHLVERQDNIEVYNGYRVVRFDGDQFARTVDICRGEGECDPARPHKQIEADAFFVEREPQPNSGMVAKLLRRTNSGAIDIDATNGTSNPRIFAAGDVTTVGVEQIIVALGEGARAGLSAYRQLTLQQTR